MSPPIDQELISLCASILSDDEVTPDEAYALAEWLNNHSEAVESWPGRELAGLLQEIWTDGVVSPRDLQRLARMLGGLEREWSRRSTPSDTHRKVKLVDFARALGKTPLVPRIAANIDVHPWDEMDTIYRVNLRGPSCTCEEWLQSKSRLPAGHLGRCCKHIFDAYAQLPRGHAGAEWLMAFLDLGRPTAANIKWKLLNPESDPILISSANQKGWADVFAKDESAYQRYSYNIEEARWCYGIAPESDALIVDEIGTLSRVTNGRVRETEESIAPPRPVKAVPFPFGLRLLIVAAAAAALAFGFVNLKSQLSAKALGRSSRETATAAAWKTKTTRPTQVTISGRPTIIPAGTELRVIARTPAEVMVSYGGETLTIPLANTDLK